VLSNFSWPLATIRLLKSVVQISVFFRVLVCADGRPDKNRTNELACYIEPDAARVGLGQTTKSKSASNENSR